MIRRNAGIGLVGLVVLVIGACSGSAPAGPASGEPTSPQVGVVIDVDSAGLDDVGGFTIRTSEGREIAFVMGDLENAIDFPPAHIGEHLASGEPVRVLFRADGDDLVAYRIEDAGE